MTILKINYTLIKDNLSLYKFPLLHGNQQLKRIYLTDSESDLDLDLDLSEIEFGTPAINKNSKIRQVYYNFNGEINAEYN